MKIYVDAAYESLNHFSEELCGDNVQILRQNQEFVAVLADGLGSGVKANILSTMTSKIIATMLSGGAKLEDAIETMAHTLPVCSEREIAYSTFTIMRVSENNCELAEFDNPFAVIIRDNRLLELVKSPLKVSGKTIYKSSFEPIEGDLLIMFSDGVVHAGVGKLLDLGWQYENSVNYLLENTSSSMTPREVCHKLLGAVESLYMGEMGDDSTVCTIRFKKSNPVTIMIGPPLNREKDFEVVSKLMASQGTKVVCGGTTSQIVSNTIGASLEVSLNYQNPSVPPTASIKGIDLVTEGVLTMGKALEIVRNYNTMNMNQRQRILAQKDAASTLARLLLEEATQVNFLVGRAINPAHQNPDMPISLGLKLNLIKDMQNELLKLGKDVSIEYY